ncbi:hypothetical protein KQX54_014889 [Cotesia glomerata]|uniref:Lipoprotein n=1 Tax=Cotesia glomerata TaxID=32391 RepID=A0AAV7IPD4_COTGL|nr:hypothetical protein KQX54_014889 [Cotesia glomerata]
MKLTFSFLFAATVLGLAACFPQVFLYYNNELNTIISSWDFEGNHVEVINREIGSVPLQWTVEVINPVDRPSKYSVNDFLSLLVDTESWILKPYFENPSKAFDSWNVWIRVPVYWRYNKILLFSGQKNYFYANFLLNNDFVRYQTVLSRSENISSTGCREFLDIDSTFPLSLTYRNNKLTVGFTARHLQFSRSETVKITGN